MDARTDINYVETLKNEERGGRNSGLAISTPPQVRFYWIYKIIFFQAHFIILFIYFFFIAFPLSFSLSSHIIDKLGAKK